MLYDLIDTGLRYLSLITKLNEMLYPWIFSFSHHHGALFASRTRGKGEVIGWGESPLTLFVHQKVEVLGMVITVVGQDIEHSKAKHLFTMTSITSHDGSEPNQVFIVERRKTKINKPTITLCHLSVILVPMKLLHTSDWHLGRMLYRQKRYEEFSLFLDWLLDTIIKHDIDILLISGDIFDTTTPSNQAQKLYYSFLSRLSGTACHSTVIIGGNHDSPTFLNAPRTLLEAINVHLVGSKTETLEEEVLVLYHEGKPQAIVCAVPYLRDRDIRSVEPGETLEDKNTKLAEGLKTHYEEVCSLAVEKQEALSLEGYPSIPIIAMGHLFAAGGKTIDGDGVRDLYVGSLSHVGADMFPPSIDYLALGHLHVPQVVGGFDHMRYSGSPIPMGFGEAKQDKQVVLVEFSGSDPTVTPLLVPCFQQLVRISGTLDTIASHIEKLKAEDSTAWLEIEYTGGDGEGNLREQIASLVEGSSLVVTIIKNKRTTDRLLSAIHEHETLEDLDTSEVFKRRLDVEEIPDEERIELTASYTEIVRTLVEADRQAE